MKIKIGEIFQGRYIVGQLAYSVAGQPQLFQLRAFGNGVGNINECTSWCGRDQKNYFEEKNRCSKISTHISILNNNNIIKQLQQQQQQQQQQQESITTDTTTHTKYKPDASSSTRDLSPAREDGNAVSFGFSPRNNDVTLPRLCLQNGKQEK